MTTVSNSEVGTSDLADAPAERETVPQASIARKSAVTFGDIWVRALPKLHAYFTPPNVFTDSPATMGELRKYAHAGGWTSKTGTLRSLGVGYFRLVARPTTVICRYVEWIAQRPGRAVPVYLLWKLVIRTAPGPWVAEHVIHPLASFAGWLFL